VNAVGDLGNGLTGVQRGKFTGSIVVELPGDANSREASSGLYKIYEAGLTAAEFSDVKLIGLFVYPQSFLNFQKPVTKLDEVKGLKIATVARGDAEIAGRLGAAPVTTTPGELYETMNRRMASGVIIGWLGLVGFKLHETVNYHWMLPTGSGGGFLIMNKDAYAKLPAKARAAVDRNAGYSASRQFGEALDRIYANSEAQVRAMAGHTIASLDAAEKAKFQAVAQPVIDEWVKATPNGAAILAAYRAEVARVRAEK
jgi:TRAP-type C4-dicarboxylate transport system substrate-binding protein